MAPDRLNEGGLRESHLQAAVAGLLRMTGHALRSIFDHAAWHASLQLQIAQRSSEFQMQPSRESRNDAYNCSIKTNEPARPVTQTRPISASRSWLIFLSVSVIDKFLTWDAFERIWLSSESVGGRAGGEHDICERKRGAEGAK